MAWYYVVISATIIREYNDVMIFFGLFCAQMTAIAMQLLLYPTQIGSVLIWPPAVKMVGS